MRFSFLSTVLETSRACEELLESTRAKRPLARITSGRRGETERRDTYLRFLLAAAGPAASTSASAMSKTAGRTMLSWQLAGAG